MFPLSGLEVDLEFQLNRVWMTSGHMTQNMMMSSHGESPRKPKSRRLNLESPESPRRILSEFPGIPWDWRVNTWKIQIGNRMRNLGSLPVQIGQIKVNPSVPRGITVRGEMGRKSNPKTKLRPHQGDAPVQLNLSFITNCPITAQH